MCWISRAFFVSSAFSPSLWFQCRWWPGWAKPDYTEKSHPDPNYSQVFFSQLKLFAPGCLVFLKTRTEITHQRGQCVFNTVSGLHENMGRCTTQDKHPIRRGSWGFPLHHENSSECRFVQLLSLRPSGGTSAVMSLSGKDGAKWLAELWDCWLRRFGRTLPLTTQRRWSGDVHVCRRGGQQANHAFLIPEDWNQKWVKEYLENISLNLF